MTAIINRLRAASRRPASLGEVPDGVVSLAIGEPAGTTPPSIIAEAHEAMLEGRTRYAPTSGTEELRSAVLRYLGASGSTVADPRSVVITHGAAAGLASVIQALVEPGERVVIPEPTYSLYADLVALTGGETVWVPPQPDGRVHVDRVLESVPDARMLILCHPSNPTGEVLSPAAVHALITECERHGVLCVLDEAYRDLILAEDASYTSGAEFLDSSQGVIVVGTFSKTFAMTGWRLGFVAASPLVAEDVGFVHRTFNGAISMSTQDAASRAFDLLPDLLTEVRQHYASNLNLVIEALESSDRVSLARPQGAFYAFPKLATSATSDEMITHFAQHGVLLRSGREFGPSGEGFVRLSFSGETTQVDEGLQRMRTAIRDLP